MANEWDHPDYDENPEWTEKDFAKARPASEMLPPEIVAQLVRPRGRPTIMPQMRKCRVTIRLSPDILEHYRAGGRGWQTRLEATLRSAMSSK